ncbi:MFS transporter [Nocardia sp. NPDC060256]|uniref:MFS transporter n=1 Tax=unclassified Nocardia TaxID=2637762 RepID=UPI003668C6D1
MASPPKTSLKTWLSLVAVGLGIMMVQLDGTVVVVANPAIADDLGAGLNSLQWVMTGYLLVLAGLLIPAGNLADKIGRKKSFIIGVTGFTVASLLCAVSNSIELLIGARVLQGIFGSLLIPAALAVVKAAFPPEKLASAIGLFSGVTAVALASGPIIGAVVVEHLSWPWVFWINLPLGILSIILTVLVINESKEKSPKPLDVPGGLSITLAIVSLVWALTHGEQYGWGSVKTLGYLLGGMLLLGAFVLIQSKRKHPMVPLDLFRIRSLSVGCVLMIVTMFAFYAIIYYLNFFLQGMQGKDPIPAAIAVLPLTLTFIISAPIGGFATEKFGVKGPLVVGALCIAASSLLLLRLEIDSGMLVLGPPLVLSGIGLGLMMVAATQAIVGSAPTEKAGTAAGMQNSLSQLGSLLGTAVFGTILSAVISSRFATQLYDAFGSGRPPVVDQLANDVDTLKLVELGFPPQAETAYAQQAMANGAPADQAAQFAATFAHAARETFLSGLHTVFLVSAGVAVVAALLSLLVSNEDTKGDQMAAYV